MRLLNTKSLRLEEFYDNVPEYAILSHRWLAEEVTYQDLTAGRQKSMKGWTKISKCCQLANSRGISYAWVDTCCIDKTNSTELAESINSMYIWYEQAKECYAYLSDVQCQQVRKRDEQKEFVSSVWFLRGWTLQELIASKRVLFYNCNWDRLGCRVSLEYEITSATSIGSEVLQGKLHPFECPVAQRLSWASRRETTRIEDRAYSLLGLLGVNMPLLYGERERAFQRLQEEFLKISDDQTIFAWSDKQLSKSILAPAPDCFKDCNQMQRIIPTNDTTEGFNMHNTGLKIQLQLIPWAMNTYLAPLRCGLYKKSRSQNGQKRFMRLCLFLHRTQHDSQYIRISLKKNDRVLLEPEALAEMCKPLNLYRQSIVTRRSGTDVTPMFYGFEFIFRHERIFADGTTPRSADVICAHKWKPRDPVFQITNSEPRMAGVFRLSGISKKLYMYLGFDEYFQPVCLVTSRSPDGLLYDNDDFNKLSESKAIAVLDDAWLDSQLDLPSSDGIWVRFRGDRQAAATIDCKTLQLRVSFEIVFSKSLQQKVWRITLENLARCSDSALNDSESDEKISKRPAADRKLPQKKVEKLAVRFKDDSRVKIPLTPSRDREALDLATTDKDVNIQFQKLAAYRMKDALDLVKCTLEPPEVRAARM